MSRIPDFLASLTKMRDIHVRKNDDYSTDANPLSNFDFGANLLREFTSPEDQIFVALLGVKLGRLSTLLNSNRSPNNESIEDTFIDLANYVLLWKAHYTRRIGGEKNENPI